MRPDRITRHGSRPQSNASRKQLPAGGWGSQKIVGAARLMLYDRIQGTMAALIKNNRPLAG
jgi:hypothetical protein